MTKRYFEYGLFALALFALVNFWVVLYRDPTPAVISVCGAGVAVCAFAMGLVSGWRDGDRRYQRLLDILTKEEDE